MSAGPAWRRVRRLALIDRVDRQAPVPCCEMSRASARMQTERGLFQRWFAAYLGFGIGFMVGFKRCLIQWFAGRGGSVMALGC